MKRGLKKGNWKAIEAVLNDAAPRLFEIAMEFRDSIVRGGDDRDKIAREMDAIKKRIDEARGKK